LNWTELFLMNMGGE